MASAPRSRGTPGSGTPWTCAGGDTVGSVEFEPSGEQRDASLDVLVRGVASAPLTFAWLLVLFVTTRIQRSAGRRGSRRIQRRHSTNLRRLRSEPLLVLTKSLFWTDDRRWWPYVPMFVGIVAPAERRLRWWRWLLVGIAAHVIGTYVGQGYLRHSIKRARAPRRLANARDVGVSYFVLGVAGTLSGYVERRWRARCQVAAVAALTGNAALRPTFTEVGHLTAFVVGLAAVPLAPGREGMPYPGPIRAAPEEFLRCRPTALSSSRRPARVRKGCAWTT
jgi:Rhomboid-like protein